MSKQLKLKIVTPERLILEESVESVTLPTASGVITVLPRHTPIISELKSGDIVAKKDGEEIPMAVSGGFVEVKKDKAENTEVTILADFAEHVSELSDEKVAQARARADELKQKASNKEVVDFEHFSAELERSLTRVKIADKWRTKKYRK